MLKAITADYCGDGKGWTGTERSSGGEMRKADQYPTADIVGAPDSKGIEAIWGPNGALCRTCPGGSRATRPTFDLSLL